VSEAEIQHLVAFLLGDEASPERLLFERFGAQILEKQGKKRGAKTEANNCQHLRDPHRVQSASPGDHVVRFHPPEMSSPACSSEPDEFTPSTSVRQSLQRGVDESLDRRISD
jgi:hypothetical protein